MGGSVSRLQNTVDGLAQDIGATMTTLSSTMNNLQRDTSGTVANVANECVESLRLIVQQTEHTIHLITNGFYAMMTAIVLGIFLYLTDCSPLLRAIVWSMYACLCLHMLMTYIRHCRPRTPITTLDRRELEQIIARSKNPSEIVLTGFKLNDEGMMVVVAQAINNSQCTNLKLIACQISASAAQILADALFRNETLIRLSLWNNQIGDRGVQYLSNALSVNNNSLKKLDLSQNDITDEGVGYLAQMLKTNRVLTNLSLSNNRITDQGIQLLANTLQKRNRTLQALSLTENKSLTDTSVGILLNMLENNRSLKQLWINDCSLSEKGQDRLERATQGDCKLYC